MSSPLLPTVSPDQALAQLHAPAGRETLDAVAAIMEDVRRNGLSAVRKHAERLGDIAPGALPARPRLRSQSASTGRHRRLP